jgi:hypothetical protein
MFFRSRDDSCLIIVVVMVLHIVVVGGRVSSWSRVEASCAGLQSVGMCNTVQPTVPVLYFLYVIRFTKNNTLHSILLYIDRFEKLRNQYLMKAKTVFFI